MIDPALLRKDLENTAARLVPQRFILDTRRIAALEAERKSAQVKTQALQSERNTRSKSIGKAKAAGEDIEPLLAQMSDLGEQLKTSEGRLAALQDELESICLDIPNLTHPSVPNGDGEEDNRVERHWGSPREFTFAPLDHADLGPARKQMDFELAGKLTGSRFVTLQGALARLHRALIQFMLDVHTKEHGYTEVYVPYMVNADSLRGTGQLPKFAEDLFYISEQDYYLIPTAEVPVTNFMRDRVVDAEQLPMHFVCHSPCFRSEAGSYGKDTRGMLRQHQFEKVEMIHIVRPEDSYQALEAMVGHAETILQRLELPYRVVTLCSADIGFGAAKTYDLEVWMPAQDKYREVSSCSNCEDFQARRMKARWRNGQSAKPELVHTLNGSGVAVGRAMISLMENHQTEDGRIGIPAALRPYLDGAESI